MDIFTGVMVKTENHGHVRSFAMTHDDFERIHLRSNKRFDTLIDLKLSHEQIRETVTETRKRKYLLVQHQNEEKGISGQCILRELSYFDVGSSFMADSLHNVYIGAFVCIEDYVLLLLYRLS